MTAVAAPALVVWAASVSRANMQNPVVHNKEREQEVDSSTSCSLSFSPGELSVDFIAALLRQPFGPDIHTLDLSKQQLSGTLVDALLSNIKSLNKLDILDLSYNHIGTQKACEVLHAPWSNLCHLGLQNCAIWRGDCEQLAQNPWPTSLRSLDLGHNRLTDQGLEKITTFTQLGQLEALGLESNELSDEALVKLVGSSLKATTRYLNISHNMLSDSGFCALAEADIFPFLTHLELAHNSIRAQGLHAFFHPERLSNLTHLGLSHTRCGTRGAEAIAKGKNLYSLEYLDLNACLIKDSGFAALLGRKELDALTFLDLSRNDISNAPLLKQLPEHPMAHSLTSLTLNYNNISQIAVLPFLDQTLFPRLTHLSIRGVQLDDKTQHMLSQSHLNVIA